LSVPRDPLNGRIMPVKFLYEIGDKILIECNSGYVNTGRPKPFATRMEMVGAPYPPV
ncbi:Locomotionrelated protein Hikaru genkilike, partial [Caligus rogercresseyi]